MAAAASEAAAAQGKFWEFHDALFPEQPKLSRETALRVAAEIGLDARKPSSTPACTAPGSSATSPRPRPAAPPAPRLSTSTASISTAPMTRARWSKRFAATPARPGTTTSLGGTVRPLRGLDEHMRGRSAAVRSRRRRTGAWLVRARSDHDKHRRSVLSALRTDRRSRLRRASGRRVRGDGRRGPRLLRDRRAGWSGRAWSAARRPLPSCKRLICQRRRGGAAHRRSRRDPPRFATEPTTPKLTSRLARPANAPPPASSSPGTRKERRRWATCSKEEPDRSRSWSPPGGLLQGDPYFDPNSWSSRRGGPSTQVRSVPRKEWPTSLPAASLLLLPFP